MSRKVIPVSVQLAKGNPNRFTKTEIESRLEEEQIRRDKEFMSYYRG